MGLRAAFNSGLGLRSLFVVCCKYTYLQLHFYHSCAWTLLLWILTCKLTSWFDLECALSLQTCLIVVGLCLSLFSFVISPWSPSMSWTFPFRSRQGVRGQLRQEAAVRAAADLRGLDSYDWPELVCPSCPLPHVRVGLGPHWTVSDPGHHHLVWSSHWLVFLLELELVSTVWTSLVTSCLTLTAIPWPVLFRPVGWLCHPTPLQAPFS